MRRERTCSSCCASVFATVARNLSKSLMPSMAASSCRKSTCRSRVHSGQHTARQAAVCGRRPYSVHLHLERGLHGPQLGDGVPLRFLQPVGASNAPDAATTAQTTVVSDAGTGLQVTGQMTAARTPVRASRTPCSHRAVGTQRHNNTRP